MPFPFLPGGAILGAAVLMGALAIFWLALVAMDRAAGRAAAGLRDSPLAGIVSGWRSWAPRSPDRRDLARGLAESHPSAIEIIELEGSSGRLD
ncbi:MAG: hypothetical protein H0U52_01555 [Chloroflexi bacterium]|nr:hypothetical protein [Chloroflexota bacterium]